MCVPCGFRVGFKWVPDAFQLESWWVLGGSEWVPSGFQGVKNFGVSKFWRFNIFVGDKKKRKKYVWGINFFGGSTFINIKLSGVPRFLGVNILGGKMFIV